MAAAILFCCSANRQISFSAASLLKLRIIAEGTGQAVEKLANNTDSYYFRSAQEALEYGINQIKSSLNKDIRGRCQEPSPFDLFYGKIITFLNCSKFLKNVIDHLIDTLIFRVC